MGDSSRDGAGWMRSDYDDAGLAYDPPATRIERLDEALTIIRGLLGPNAVTHHGRHYQVTELDGVPKPIQAPVPILVGGGGRRVLAVAARHADIVSINFDLRAGTLDAVSGRTAPPTATPRSSAGCTPPHRPP